jgi:Na+:H+ antiporter, NhaA family
MKGAQQGTSFFDRTLQRFKKEEGQGVLLILCAVAALIISNSSWNEGWFRFWETETGPAGLGLHKSILHWVNDGLMAIFFLLVGLEIKKEIIEGELSSLKKAFLPIAAALGGMIFPALVYVLFNLGKSSISGWGIPMATDIAFALAVLALLGKRVPVSLKIMLTALAIVDDLGAIVVIAIFYSNDIAFSYLAMAGGAFLILLLLNKAGVKSIALYLLIGVALWYFMLKSGVHSTIAGVLLAFSMPLGKDELSSTAEKLLHLLHTPVNYFIMPLFALANTGFIVEAGFTEAVSSPASLGIIAGLVLGKPAGIFLFSWLSVKFGLAHIPSGATMKQLLGIGFLGGIGFTMSIFISLLAFGNPEMQAFSKIAILAASVIAGITGFFLLKGAATRRLQ